MQVELKSPLSQSAHLDKYGYPPDKQEKATRTVLEQAELFGYELV